MYNLSSVFPDIMNHPPVLFEMSPVSASVADERERIMKKEFDKIFICKAILAFLFNNHEQKVANMRNENEKSELDRRLQVSAGIYR